MPEETPAGRVAADALMVTVAGVRVPDTWLSINQGTLDEAVQDTLAGEDVNAMFWDAPLAAPGAALKDRVDGVAVKDVFWPAVELMTTLLKAIGWTDGSRAIRPVV